jgi:hypothetical protein
MASTAFHICPSQNSEIIGIPNFLSEHKKATKIVVVY